jgi:hypothetical protein
VGFERLVGLNGERVVLPRFLVVGMRGSCIGFAVGGVSVSARGGSAVELSMCVANANLPPGNLLMVEALCGVGEN